MSNYRIKYSIITNNIKFQFGLHHCDRLVETIEMDILFVRIGVRMKKIRKRQNRCNADVSGTHSPSPYSRMRGDRLEATTSRPAVGCSQRRGRRLAAANAAATRARPRGRPPALATWSAVTGPRRDAARAHADGRVNCPARDRWRPLVCAPKVDSPVYWLAARFSIFRVVSATQSAVQGRSTRLKSGS
jgi:hypothetical protein